MNNLGPDREQTAAPSPRPKKRRLKKRISRWLALKLTPPVAIAWMRLYDWSARCNNHRNLTLINEEALISRVSSRQQPTIMTAWHNRMMFGPTAYKYMRGAGVAIMISRSFDGEVSSRVLEKFKDFTPVRGSSANKPGQDKGGQEALMELVEWGKKGYDLGITPDGPLGPRYKVKRGVIDLARATGYPIMTAGVTSKKFIEIKSWDRTRLPIPFTRVVYIASDPIWVPPDADEDMIEQKRQELERVMIELNERADNFFKQRQ